MAIVFKTPKSTLNTTSKAIQNLGGDCPPCPEPVLEGKELNYTQNGEYTVTPEQGVDGFSSIDVTVNVPTVNNQNKSVTISSNGESTISADSGYSGLGEVTVTVDVDPVLGTTSVVPTTSLQTITPPQGYDGFDQVNVLAVDSNIDPNILSDNIKNGITILGVTGNYSGSAINNQNKTVSPSTSQQSVSADQGYTGLGTVTVNAVTSAIDQNIAAGNIKNGVSILGVTGTYNPIPDLQAKTVNPSTSQQTVTPDQGKDGLSSVTVNAVTAAIDANIVAENILDGVTILGVTGSDLGYDVGYSDGYAQGQAECPEPGGCDHTAYVQETITTNGTYTYDPSDYQGESYDAFDGVEITVNVPSGGTNVPDWSSIGFTSADVQGIADSVDYSADVKSDYIDNNQFVPEMIWYKMAYWPSGVYEKYNSSPYLGTTMPQIMKDVTWYWERGSSWAQTSFFSGFSGLQKIDSISFVDTNNNTIKPQGLYRCFNRCASLKETPAIDVSEATDVTGMFQDCTSLTRINGSLDLSSATSMYQLFSGCESLQTFPQILNTSGVTSLQECFQRTNCENYPLFNTAGVTNVRSMFFQAHSITSTNHQAANIPAYDFSSVIEVDYMFGGNAFYYNDSDTPVTFGGFTNLGKAFTGVNASYHTLDLSTIGEAVQTIVIPKQSLMNIINALSAPDDATCTDATLKLSAKQYGMLDASDIAIATAKNWSVISA